MKEYQRKWYLKNRERLLKQGRQYYLKNKEKHSECMKKYYIKHKEEILKNTKQYRTENREKCLKYCRKYNIDNREKIRKYEGIKYKTNPKYNLNQRMKRLIRLSIKGNKAGRHWEDLVGFTLGDLIKRLKKTMPVGCTWIDFLEGRLHIDHIIPVSAFNFARPEHIDFKGCWALSNLQLTPAKENLIKHNKLLRPFQPALRIKKY